MRISRIIIPAARVGLTVDPGEADGHHLARVLRAVPGTVVEVLNGAGGRFRGIYHGRKGGVEIVEELAVDEHVEPITVVQALLKSSRMDWLVEKLSELGVERLIPVIAQRSVGRARVERWQRIADESAKQCGRAQLMRIDEASSLSSAVTTVSVHAVGWVLDPSGSPPTMAVRGARDITVVAGPEGGLTDEESAVLRSARYAPVRLARPILRGETAAIAGVASVMALRGVSEAQALSD